MIVVSYVKNNLLDFLRLTSGTEWSRDTSVSDVLINKKVLDEITFELYESIDDVDFSSSDYRLLVNGEGISGETAEMIFGTSRKNVLFDGYSASWSIILLGADRISSSIAAWTSEICCSTGQRVHANCYITPPFSSGAAPHVDDHDVLVLQLYGQKHWRLGNAVSGANDLTIHEGAAFFLPRGLEHSTSTSNIASVHVTFGFGAIPSVVLKPTLGHLKRARASNIPTLMQLDSIRDGSRFFKLRIDLSGQECIARIDDYFVGTKRRELENLFYFLAYKSAADIQLLFESSAFFSSKAKEKLASLLIRSGCATALV